MMSRNINPPHAQASESPWWCTMSTGKTRYPSHKIRAPACTSWDMLLFCSCQRTETPTGKAIHPFSSAISSMFGPFQWPQCPGVSVTSFGSWHCQWDSTDASMCKDHGDPLKILLGLSEDETLQPLPNNSPEHSHSNTAPASKGDMQRHYQYPPMPAMLHQLDFATSGSPLFSLFSNSCSDFFKFLPLSVFGVFFRHFSFWYNRRRLSLTLEKAWSQQILLPLPWKWTEALLRVRQTSLISPQTHF